MRKFLILLSLALGTLQAQAFSIRVLRVDDRIPAGNIVVDKTANGTSCLNGARMNAPGAHVCLCFEVPFANDGGVEVNPETSALVDGYASGKRKGKP